MPRPKRKATTNIASPPSKIRPKTINGPRLNHNGRLALICFLSHRSHRPTSPYMDDVETSADSSSSSSISVESVDEAVNEDVNQSNPASPSNVDEENEVEEMETESQSSSSNSESSVSEHQLNLNLLLNEDIESEESDYVPNDQEGNDDDVTSSEESETTSEESETTGEEILEDEDELTDSEESSNGEHNFLNLLQVLEAAVANDDSEAGSSYVEADRSTRRVMMLSSRFLRSFFAGHTIILKVGYDYQNFDLILEWQDVGASIFQLNAKTLNALIGLSDLKKIHIVAYPIFDERPVDIQKGMQSWIQVCRALKNSKTLQSISLEIGRARPSPYRIFLDMIPDKITEVKSKISIVHGLAGRKCILDGVYLYECTKNNPDYGQVFRTKTKLLDLSRCKSIILNDLANVGQLCANPYLESLKIGVCLKDSDNKEENWTKLEESFMCLKTVNEKMELKFITSVFYSKKVKNLRHGIEALKQTLNNLRRLIDLTKKVGFQLKKVKIFDLVLFSRRCPKNTIQQMAHSANLKAIDKETIIDTIMYSGVQIIVKLCHGIPEHFSVF